MAALEAQLAALEAERERLTAAPSSPARAARRIHLIAALWEAGEYRQLAALIASLVESVDLREDHAVVHLLPVMAIVTLVALTAPMVYPERFRRRIFRAA